MSDEQLCSEMLWLYREYVYKPLTKIGIACEVWTLAQLRAHFDINNHHIVDPIRSVAASIRSTLDLKNKTQRSCEVPDPANPGRTFINHKAVASYEKLTKLALLELKMYTAFLDGRRDNVLAGIRNLGAIISREQMREIIAVDSRSAAGAIQQGGDAARTVGVQKKATSRDINNM